MKKPENILIVRTDRIGDLVLTLPLAGIIKKHYPGCRVHFLVRNYTKNIVEGHPYIDNVIVLKEQGKKILFYENIRELKKYGFDSCIVVYPTFKIALMMLLAGIKLRAGTGYRWYSFLFNKKTFEHRKYAEHHELEYNVNLLKNIDIDEKVSPGKIKFDIKAKSNCVYKIEQLLFSNKVSSSRPIIVVHPGSGGSAVDLPLIKLKNLVILMAQELKVDIILIGSESEKKLCEDLMVHPSVKNFAGLMNLDELIALLSKAEILIGNSSGPIHLAAALEKYVIGFYPKITACSPKRWGPYTEKKFIFTPEIDCSNCTKEQCKKLDCMSSIEINRVFEKIKYILQDSVVEK